MDFGILFITLCFLLLLRDVPTLIVATHTQIDEYCSENLYQDSTDAFLTKEVPSREYGIIGSSKSIYCCAQNYESILWLKNGREYPWPGSSFILNGVGRNQTVHANSLTKDDSGTYGCRITNKAGANSYFFNLTVFDGKTGYTDVPLATYVPPKIQNVHIGKQLRLYCEAFVGKIDLPDAKTEITWYKEIPNSSFSSGNQVYVNKVVRDHGLTIGLYLIIDKLDSRSCGDYTCYISNAGDQKIDMTTYVATIEQPDIYLLFERIPLTILYPLCLIVFLALIVYCLCAKYGQEVYIYVRQHARCDKYDGVKDYDIFLLYEQKDEDFVTDILIPKLQEKYGYVIYSQLLEKNSALTMECQSKIATSRCVLIIWSSLSSSRNTDKIFLQKLQFITTLHRRVVCIVMEDASTLKSYFKTGILNSLKPVDFIKWTFENLSDIKKNSRIWCQLRSCLPPKLGNKKRCDSSEKLYTYVNGRRLSRLDV